MDDWTRVLLYGTFDGFGWSTDGDDNILLILDNGDKVETPSHFVKNASDFVEKNQIKLKDVIARIKQLDIGTRKLWLDEFLSELGSDYGLLKYKDGYEQGKVEGLIEREKVQVPQFVADWIDNMKCQGKTLYYGLDHTPPEEVDLWFCEDEVNRQNTFARAWLDGYEVEEKRYKVKVKGVYFNSGLVFDKTNKKWFFSSIYEVDHQRGCHTRKELEDAGFGWVFDCPGVEIEEVE